MLSTTVGEAAVADSRGRIFGPIANGTLTQSAARTPYLRHSCFLTVYAGLSRPQSARWQRTRPRAIRRRMLDFEERGEVAIMRLQHGQVNALDLELLPTTFNGGGY